MNQPVIFLLLASLGAAGPAFAASGSEVYKAHCSLCHDSGATRAPRLGNLSDWDARIAKGRVALVTSAIKGVPDSAMLPKAGFPHLSNADVIAATDFMLSSLGFAIRDAPWPEAQKPAPAPAQPAAQPTVDDAALTARVAEALRARIAPSARVETAGGTRVAGIRVESSAGRITLTGMVNDGGVVRSAEETARAVAGVAGVVNKLVGADVFEHD